MKRSAHPSRQGGHGRVSRKGVIIHIVSLTRRSHFGGTGHVPVNLEIYAIAANRPPLDEKE
jgi:hypothetical protein